MARGDLTVDEIRAILPLTPGRIAELTAGLTAAQLRTAPGPAAWSLNDILAHLRACHDVLGGNMLRILTEGSPTWRAMNPRSWMARTDYPDWEFAPAFAVFRRQRTELLAVLDPLAPDDWERTARVTGLAGGAADLSIRYYGSWMAGHERAHLRHMADIVETLT
jgi:hypothetical protein